jgi:hypothetical protein
VSETVSSQLDSKGLPSPWRSCATCVSFRSDPFELESAIAGLRSFGSGFAAVCSNDGLCVRHDRYLSASACCAGHELRR